MKTTPRKCQSVVGFLRINSHFVSFKIPKSEVKREEQKPNRIEKHTPENWSGARRERLCWVETPFFPFSLSNEFGAKSRVWNLGKCFLFRSFSFWFNFLFLSESNFIYFRKIHEEKDNGLSPFSTQGLVWIIFLKKIWPFFYTLFFLRWFVSFRKIKKIK